VLKKKYFPMLLDYIRGRFLFNNTIITSDCTCRCVMCNYWRMEKAYMSRKLFMKVMKTLENLGSHTISLTGGEPMIHPSFFDFVKLASKKEFYINNATNGTLLSEKNVRKMKEAKIDSVYISIDSLNPKISAWIRGFPNQLKLALNGIKLLRKYGIPRSANTLLGRHNLNDFKDIVIQLDETYDTPTTLVFPDPSIGPLEEKSLEGIPNYKFTEQEISKVVDELISLKKQGYRVANTLTYLKDIKHAYTGEKRHIPCFGGKYSVNIYWDGRVTPCFNKQNTICQIDELTKEHLEKGTECYDCLSQCFVELSFLGDCIKNRRYYTALKESMLNLKHFT